MRKRNLILTAAIILTSMLFVQCSKDEDTGMEQKGQVSVKITDAPSDDANIQGTFITIADVKIDGQSVEGFTKQTIEVSAYRNGEAKLVMNDEVAAKTYNSVTIVLDNEGDASGEVPGCYVLTNDDKKHNLSASSPSATEISFNRDFTVDANGEASMVIDFDLRKLVVRDTTAAAGESQYKFVTTAEMANSVRMVQENNSGEISGKVNTMFNTENDMYVFAYHKDDFDMGMESSGQGNSNVMFANAVTSAKVKTDGSYRLSFLDEGDYEIHVASFEKDNGGHVMFNGMVDASSAMSGMMMNSITVSANSNTELNIDITGLL
ncbi:MAG TPA: DUF4382 domain-containing protein [Draconibacterium sp.]|nr:DUF4382 domain-containing protein [Draconibacterium sp.]